MNLRAPILTLALLLAAACDGFPKDPDGTLERVRAERQFKVGIISSAAPVRADRQRLFLQQVSAAANAKPVVESGASERLLARLEGGELDLVVGELTPKTPWAANVTLLPLLGEQVTRDEHVHVAAAAKHGENAWISLLHKAAVKVAAQP